MEVSLQLYSIQEETKKDFREAVREVAGIGYRGVEFAGYGGLSAAEMKELLQENRLYSVGCHCGLPVFEEAFEAELEYNYEIGSRYMICPWTKLDTLEEVEHLVQVLNEAAVKAEKKDIKVGYHNHEHEFRKIGGKYILDLIAEQTNDNVVLELDVFWAVYAGIDPLAYIEKWGEKVELIHIKQIDEKKANVDVRDGIIDMEKVKEVARHARFFVVEHEEFDKPVWDSIRNDFEALSKI